MIKETELIKLAQLGNSTAFGKLVNRYWNKVFLLTSKYCKLEEDKEDIVQVKWTPKIGQYIKIL